MLMKLSDGGGKRTVSKNLIAVIAWLAILCSIFVAAVAEQDVSAEQEICSHHYKMFLRQDDTGYYTCMCTLCNDVFSVYPIGFEVDAAEGGEGEPCMHIFRKAVSSKKESVESVSSMSHEAAVWFDCTCELCGFTIEAYESDGHVDKHIVTTKEDVHVDGTFKHMYMGHCDLCGECVYEFVNCPHKDGACMGGFSTVPLKTE